QHRRVAIAREITQHRTLVRRVVVLLEKFRSELGRLPGAHHRFPARDDRVAVELRERCELCVQPHFVVREMRIIGLEHRDAQRLRNIEPDARRGAHRIEERLGYLQPADALALRFDVDGPRRIEAREGVEEIALECLLRRLRFAGKIAEQRPAVASEALEVEHLPARRGDRLDEARLARPGQAADHAVIELPRPLREQRDDVPAIRAIAAVELRCAKADFAEHVHERAAALSAAPAVDERRPLARLVAHVGFDDARDVAGDDRGAGLARIERRNLHVHRADERALVVVEHRQVHGAEQMIVGKFRWRANVDALAERRELVDAYRVDVTRRRTRRQWCNHRRDSSGTSVGQTLSRMRACAAALGWMRSAWNCARSSSKPLKAYGATDRWFAFATSANNETKRREYAGP